MVTTAVQALYAWITRRPDLISLLIGIAALALFGLLAIATAAIQKHSPARTRPQTRPLAAPSPPLTIPDLPRTHKIHVEILEGFVAERMMNLLSHPEPWILLRVRLVNRSDPSVTITNWELDLKDHFGASKWQAYRNDIPDTFTYTPLVWPNSSRKEEIVETRLDSRLSTIPLSLGCGEQGWLLFRTFQSSMCYVFGETFQLTVTDALDNRSQGVAYPGEWLKQANFSHS